MERKRAMKQLRALIKLQSKEHIRLAAEEWKSPFQILISTIMSARTMDEVTIPTATRLFKKFPNSKTLAKAKTSEVQKIIRPVNFYRNKSKNVIACAKMLVSSYAGKVPNDLDSLITLPGVGRKTANVFLSEIGGKGIGTDTHVIYISQKLKWTKNQSPTKIESDLKALFSKKDWNKVNSNLVRFGKTHTSRKKKDELLKEVSKVK
jgi:endonuclease III